MECWIQAFPRLQRNNERPIQTAITSYSGPPLRGYDDDDEVLISLDLGLINSFVGFSSKFVTLKHAVHSPGVEAFHDRVSVLPGITGHVDYSSPRKTSTGFL